MTAQAAMHNGVNAGDALSGRLSAIRYHKGSFLIGVLADGTPIKGDMPSPQVGLDYVLRGRWEKHPQWGSQFAFAEFRTSYPTDLAAVRAYLEENCRWVGPEVSRRLVEAYGQDTLGICRTDPGRVAREIPGLTAERAQEVARLLLANEQDENLRLEIKALLDGTGVRRTSVGRILTLWGAEAPRRIRENPYAMIEEIPGVGFLTADKVALKIGFAREGPPRLRAGILHTLKEQASGNGHTCLPEAVLLTEAARLLGVGGPLLAAEIPALDTAGKVVREDGFVYLKSYHDDEKLIAEKLKVLAREIRDGE